MNFIFEKNISLNFSSQRSLKKKLIGDGVPLSKRLYGPVYLHNRIGKLH